MSTRNWRNKGITRIHFTDLLHSFSEPAPRPEPRCAPTPTSLCHKNMARGKGVKRSAGGDRAKFAEPPLPVYVFDSVAYGVALDKIAQFKGDGDLPYLRHAEKIILALAGDATGVLYFKTTRSARNKTEPMKLVYEIAEDTVGELEDGKEMAEQDKMRAVVEARKEKMLETAKTVHAFLIESEMAHFRNEVKKMATEWTEEAKVEIEKVLAAF